ncbi:MAG: hypothetical protein KAS73_12400, partial [Candidatus Sabulitectum sp.]|nr:hypothetical protein [Candidatus Sabulitectum sp.]
AVIPLAPVFIFPCVRACCIPSTSLGLSESKPAYTLGRPERQHGEETADSHEELCPVVIGYLISQW